MRPPRSELRRAPYSVGHFPQVIAPLRGTGETQHDLFAEGPAGAARHVRDDHHAVPVGAVDLERLRQRGVLADPPPLLTPGLLLLAHRLLRGGVARLGAVADDQLAADLIATGGDAAGVLDRAGVVGGRGAGPAERDGD